MTWRPVAAPPPAGLQMMRFSQPAGKGPSAPPDTDPYLANVVLLLKGPFALTGGTYLSFPDTAAWDFPGDFTVELFVTFTSHTIVQSLVDNYNTSNGWVLQRRSDTNVLSFGWGNTALINPSWTPTDGVEYHIAACRTGTALRLFVNGVQLGSTVTNSLDLSGSTNPLLVGSLFDGASFIQKLSGTIRSLRITKGTGRYTANFTPPTHFPNS